MKRPLRASSKYIGYHMNGEVISVLSLEGRSLGLYPSTN